jgi:hypothetical protein
MKLSIIVLALTLVGCSTTVPVRQSFPEAPKVLLTKPSELKQTQYDAKPSEVISTVVENYGTYYDVSDQLEAWQEWYAEQKRIYESVK